VAKQKKEASKLTIGSIIDLWQTLHVFRGQGTKENPSRQLPPNVAFRLSAAKRAMLPIIEDFNAERNALVEKHKGDDGEIMKESQEKFNDEFNQLLAVEVDFDIQKIPIKWLSEPIDGNLMDVLHHLFEE